MLLRRITILINQLFLSYSGTYTFSASNQPTPLGIKSHIPFSYLKVLKIAASHVFPRTMAISTPKKPQSLPVLAFIVIYLMLLQRAHSLTYSTTFTFERFDSDTDLLMQGNAVFSRDLALELTKERDGIPQGGSVGRTFCTFPVILQMSGKVATIYTNFVLNISQPNSTTTPADGITFFIAPISDLPPRSGGAFLGLFSNQSSFSNSGNEEIVGFNKASNAGIVAVEFDTYSNLDIGDPNYRHIGIDVNSIRSEVTAEWEWQNGEPLNVTITYDPSVKRLRVLASYPNGSPVDFTHDIDLATVLPGQVYAGFSGSTGQYAQVNHVNSWSFNSTLVLDDDSYSAEEGGVAIVA